MNTSTDYRIDTAFLYTQLWKQEDLEWAFKQFDQYLFRGLLKPYVRVEWEPAPHQQLNWVGRCMSDPQRPNGILISIVRNPPHVVWHATCVGACRTRLMEMV